MLEIKRVMDEESPIMTPSSSLIWAVMHHVFVAAVILLVDVCFNWEDVLATKRKDEVIAACRMLTNAQQSSVVARKAVDAMMDVLRKHWIQDRGLKCPHAPLQRAEPRHPSMNTSQQGSSLEIPSDMLCASHTQERSQTQQVEMPLEDFWKEMLDGGAHSGLGTPDWTDLLNDLTNTNFPE